MITANGASGTTHDFFCYDAAGDVWNGAAFVAWDDGDYATYRVTADERGTSGTFTGTAPAGTSRYEMRVQAGTLAGSYVVWAEVATIALSPETIAALAAAGGVTVYAPVSMTGQITDPIIIGDDYLASLGRAFAWDVPALPGVDVGDATCSFGIKNSSGAGFVVTGSVTEVDEDTWKLSFDVPRTSFAALTKGTYEWSAEVRDASGNEVTRVRNADFNYRVELVEKQT